MARDSLSQECDCALEGDFCPLHDAATRMLAALKAVRDECAFCVDPRVPWECGNTTHALVRAVIADAERDA